MNYDRIVKGIRRRPDLLFHADERIYDKAARVLDKALEMRAKRQTVQRDLVGPYSGLTRRELAQSGTCETDWY